MTKNPCKTRADNRLIMLWDVVTKNKLTEKKCQNLEVISFKSYKPERVSKVSAQRWHWPQFGVLWRYCRCVSRNKSRGLAIPYREARTLSSWPRPVGYSSRKDIAWWLQMYIWKTSKNKQKKKFFMDVFFVYILPDQEYSSSSAWHVCCSTDRSLLSLTLRQAYCSWNYRYIAKYFVLEKRRRSCKEASISVVFHRIYRDCNHTSVITSTRERRLLLSGGGL